MSKANSNRPSVSVQDRMIPCACCDYPISERHHVVPFSEWGDGIVLSLCANCHELWHIIDRAETDFKKYADTDEDRSEFRKRSRSARLYRCIIASWGKDDKRITYLNRFRKIVKPYEKALKTRKQYRLAKSIGHPMITATLLAGLEPEQLTTLFQNLDKKIDSLKQSLMEFPRNE